MQLFISFLDMLFASDVAINYCYQCHYSVVTTDFLQISCVMYFMALSRCLLTKNMFLDHDLL